MFCERGADERRGDKPRIEQARAPTRVGLFCCSKGGFMANHLTPEELSKELGIDRTEVIRVCMEEGVPIYHGKIDKTLFAAQLQALGSRPPEALAS
jgi:hypothetical protein